MNARVRLAMCTAALMAAATPAGAQLCAGRPSFNRAPIQLGLAAGATDGGFLLGGSAAIGTDRLFGAATFSSEPAARPDDAPRWTGGSVGASQPLRLDNRLHLCPTAGIAWSTGARSSTGAPGSRISAGVTVGLLATNGRRAALVPTFGLSVHRDRQRTASRTFATITAGVGAVMTNGLGIAPVVTIPLGDDRGSPAVAVLVTIAVPFR